MGVKFFPKKLEILEVQWVVELIKAYLLRLEILHTTPWQKLQEMLNN